MRPGECIFSIACDAKVSPVAIWDHPNNKDLRDLRKDPNVLMPGDMVFIPERETEKHTRPTGKRHTFYRAWLVKELKLQIQRAHRPVVKKPFELDVDGEKFKGSTDDKGWIKYKIPANAKLARLTVDEETFELQLGHLNPASELTGVLARLQRLGHYPAPVNQPESGDVMILLDHAVRSFQAACGVEQTGELDDKTFDLLIEACGE